MQRLSQPSEEVKGLGDYAQVLRRRIHWFVWPTLFIVLAGLALCLYLPNIYRSETIILIEGQQITESLVPTTVTSYADQRIQATAQQVMSRSKILDLVRKFDLYPEERERLTTDALVKKVQNSIQIKPISAEIKSTRSNTPSFLTIAFSLSFEGKEPRRVQQVTNELASFFLARNLEARKDSAKGTAEFLEKQVEQARVELDDLQSQIAAFKEKHLQELPEFMTVNLQNIQRMSNELDNINREALSLEEQATALSNQLATLDPYLGATSRVLSDSEQLQQLELKRAQLRARYSDAHPSLVALEKEIEILKQQVGGQSGLKEKQERLTALRHELGQLGSRYKEQHPSVVKLKAEIRELEQEIGRTGELGAESAAQENPRAVTNPAYVTMTSERDRIQVRIRNLQREKQRLTQERERLYSNLKTMPAVEKRYSELLMDYGDAKNRHTELQQKLNVARIAEGMEEGQLGERFTMIEPPFLPQQPYKPNRLAILLVSAVLALGAGGGMAAFREFGDHSVRRPEDIERLTGLTVLTVIPHIRSPRDIRRRRARNATLVVLLLAVPVVGLTAVHFLVMDLYVFYHKAARIVSERLFFSY